VDANAELRPGAEATPDARDAQGAAARGRQGLRRHRGPHEPWPWDQLGDALAIDLANTVGRRGFETLDFLRGGADLRDWSRLAPAATEVAAEEADARMDEVLALRAAVQAVLGAAMHGEPLPAAAVERINAVVRAVPLVAQLRDGETVLEPADYGGVSAVDELLARVAASAIELIGAGTEIGFCDAPSCGGFFTRSRSNQVWCSDECGTRARVARHAAHHRHGG
jgi:predicted RNA-binding Zn ribbon-like protein